MSTNRNLPRKRPPQRMQNAPKRRKKAAPNKRYRLALRARLFLLVLFLFLV